MRSARASRGPADEGISKPAQMSVRSGAHLCHALAAELELDGLNVSRCIDLNVILAFGKAGLEGSAQARHVVDLAVNEDEVRRHDLRERACQSSEQRRSRRVD